MCCGSISTTYRGVAMRVQSCRQGRGDIVKYMSRLSITYHHVDAKLIHLTVCLVVAGAIRGLFGIGKGYSVCCGRRCALYNMVV